MTTATIRADFDISRDERVQRATAHRAELGSIEALQAKRAKQIQKVNECKRALIAAKGRALKNSVIGKAVDMIQGDEADALSKLAAAEAAVKATDAELEEFPWRSEVVTALLAESTSEAEQLVADRIIAQLKTHASKIDALFAELEAEAEALRPLSMAMTLHWTDFMFNGLRRWKKSTPTTIKNRPCILAVADTLQRGESHDIFATAKAFRSFAKDANIL